MPEEKIYNLLKTVKYPGFSRDIVSFGLVKNIEISDNQVVVALSISTQNQNHIDNLKRDIEKVIADNTKISNVKIEIALQNIKQATEKNQSVQQPIPGVKHVIAVGSGKGGVGKSTVSINLAAELSKQYKVGVLDLDIYGPSLPMVIGSNEQPKITEDQKLIPINKYGMKFMSFGFINNQNAATIWRGPMVAKLTTQFFDDVIWGELDYLILDLPPGTGDIQLTLVQRLALSGAIIVTTPQDLAILDVRKGADMFKKVNTPVLGVVENMSQYICPHCQKESQIFDGKGGFSESERLEVPLLAEISISKEISQSTDSGQPYVLTHTNSKITKQYESMAKKIHELVS